MGEQQQLPKYALFLRSARAGAGLNQEEMAQKIGVCRPTYSDWERGAVLPDMDSFTAIQKAIESVTGCSVTLNDLAGIQEQEDALEASMRLIGGIAATGLRKVHLNRSSAFVGFERHLQREKNEIGIVGSSLRGVLSSERVRSILKAKAREVGEFRVLLTDPRFADSREDQEARPAGETKSDIETTVKVLLEDWQVNPNNIRYYSSAPTVFLIFTSNRMLVNPYMNRKQGCDTATFEIARSLDIGGAPNVFEQYRNYHFLEPWESAIPVSLVRRAHA